MRQCVVLAFLHVAARRLFVSPATLEPDAKWIERQSRAFLDFAHGEGIRVDYGTRDRNGKFVAEFDAALQRAGAGVITTAPQAPDQNTFVERWGKSIRDECLRHFIVFGQHHFGFFMSSYVDFYDRRRPH